MDDECMKLIPATLSPVQVLWPQFCLHFKRILTLAWVLWLGASHVSHSMTCCKILDCDDHYDDHVTDEEEIVFVWAT